MGFRKRALSVTALALASVALLAGCANDPLAEQYREGSNKNYISGSGVVKEIALENRANRSASRPRPSTATRCRPRTTAARCSL